MDLIDQLRAFVATAQTGSFTAAAEQLGVSNRLTSKYVAELEARISAAGRPVLVDYYADWCVACKDMERSTFADDRVRQRLAGWTLLQVDVTANSDDDKALLARFGLFGPPGIVFFDARGVEVPNVRVVGFQNADAFLRTLALAAP